MSYGNGGAVSSGQWDSKQGASTVMTSAQPTPRIPAISGQYEQLSKTADALGVAINELENRISAVCHPCLPEAETAEKQPAEDVPLAEGLAALNRRVTASLWRLRNITARVDL